MTGSRLSAYHCYTGMAYLCEACCIPCNGWSQAGTHCSPRLSRRFIAAHGFSPCTRFRLPRLPPAPKPACQLMALIIGNFFPFSPPGLSPTPPRTSNCHSKTHTPHPPSTQSHPNLSRLFFPSPASMLNCGPGATRPSIAASSILSSHCARRSF
jgi:hypothetical protein